MAKMLPSPKVDMYIGKVKQWQDETEELRQVMLSCGLEEDLKWGKPCYSYEGGNIAIIQGFKDYFALLFFKGVLLKDPDKVLVRTGENTHVGRQMRFENVSEIKKKKAVLKKYVNAAIEIEKAGLKVEPKKDAPLVLPDEFKTAMAKNAGLKTAFDALTPGRKRAYNIYFSQAKQSSTRKARIDKCIPQIMKGKGLNE